MNKIIPVILAMVLALASCGPEPTAASNFIMCCEHRQCNEAKGYIDEVMKNFDRYSSTEKAAIIKSMESLISYSHDQELGDAFVTFYNKVKNDKSVNVDPNAASICEWIENGFTTACEYADQPEMFAKDSIPEGSTPNDSI